MEVAGVQGFIPLSQLASIGRNQDGTSQEEQLAKRIGETVQVKLLEPESAGVTGSSYPRDLRCSSSEKSRRTSSWKSFKRERRER